MKANKTNSVTAKEKIAPADLTHRKSLDDLNQMAESNSQAIKTNNELIRQYASLAGTNPIWAETIRILSSTNHVLAETNEDILNYNDRTTKSFQNTEDHDPVTHQHPGLQYHYLVLNENEQKNPVEVLTKFAQFYSLYNQRQKIFEIFWSAMRNPLPEDDNAETKGGVILLYKSLIELVEATYKVEEMVKQSDLTFIYSSQK
jgi:hypothetical protein